MGYDVDLDIVKKQIEKFVSFEGENAKNLCPSQAHDNAHDNGNTLVFCPDCGSVEVVKNGKTRANTQVFKCKACGKRFTVNEG